MLTLTKPTDCTVNCFTAMKCRLAFVCQVPHYSQKKKIDRIMLSFISVFRSNHPNSYDYHRAMDQLIRLAGVSHHDRANHLTLPPPRRADRLNATVPLRLSTSLARDVGLAPWSVTHRHLDTWLQLLYDQVTHAPLEDFVRRLIRPLYQQLGWRDEGSHVTRLEVVAAAGGCVRAGVFY